MFKILAVIYSDSNCRLFVCHQTGMQLNVGSNASTRMLNNGSAKTQLLFGVNFVVYYSLICWGLRSTVGCYWTISCINAYKPMCWMFCKQIKPCFMITKSSTIQTNTNQEILKSSQYNILITIQILCVIRKYICK